MNKEFNLQTIRKLLYSHNLPVLIIFSLLLPTTSFARDEAHFFPLELDKQTETYMVILPFTCNLNDKLKWKEKYRNTLNGLKPNSNVSVHLKKGVPMQGTLGFPTCFSGACSANYVALPVKAHFPLDGALIISKPNQKNMLKVNVIQEGCNDVPEKPKHPYGFDFISLPTECKTLTLDSQVIGELISFGWRQNNGWAVFHQFFRSVNSNKNAIKKYGKLTEIAYSTSKQQPVLGFYDKNEKPRLLWHEKSGLGPVSRFTLRESSFDKHGNLKWASEYSAGGQPCD